jgi:hypothetical protein
MNWLRSLVRRSPRRFLVLGKAVFLVGAILVIGAVFARAGLVSINAKRAEAHQPPLRTLAEAYPAYPTWLVPEGPVGFALAAVLVIVGTGLTAVADAEVKRGRAGQPPWR